MADCPVCTHPDDAHTATGCTATVYKHGPDDDLGLDMVVKYTYACLCSRPKPRQATGRRPA